MYGNKFSKIPFFLSKLDQLCILDNSGSDNSNLMYWFVEEKLHLTREDLELYF